MDEDTETAEIPVPKETLEQAEERVGRYELVFGEELDREAVVADILTERVLKEARPEP